MSGSLQDVDEGGLPVHLPILVTKDGQGPCGDSDKDADHWDCWCGTQCSWQKALDDNRFMRPE